VGQLYAQLPEWTPECDPSEALEFLAENERAFVVVALLTAFGGVSGLYAALWNSKNLEVREADEGDDTYTADGDQLSGYSWVDQGCERYR
jgi:hypothetical protein